MNEKINKNKTLNIILNYLSENEITNIEKGVEKKLFKKFNEICGYFVKIPFEDTLPETYKFDSRELEEYREIEIEISNNRILRCGLITNMYYDGSPEIKFCSQKPQLEYLIHLAKQL